MRRRYLIVAALLAAALTGVIAVQRQFSAASGALRTITLGTLPGQIDADTHIGRIFAVDRTRNSVSVFATRTGALLRTVSVGLAPGGPDGTLVIDAASRHVFVVNAGSNSVSVLDAFTGAVQRTVPVGIVPWALAVDPRTGRLFVANSGLNSGRPGSVSVLDTHSVPFLVPFPSAVSLRPWPSTNGPDTSSSSTGLAACACWTRGLGNCYALRTFRTPAPCWSIRVSWSSMPHSTMRSW